MTPSGSVGPVIYCVCMPQQFHVKLQEPKALAESTQPFSILAAKKAPLGQRQTSKTAWWWPVPFDELPFPFWSNPFPVLSNPLSLGMNTSVLPRVICKRHATFLFGYNMYFLLSSGLYSPDLPKCYFLQIHTKICSKVPIFYFNRLKRPPDNCYVTCLLREKSALSMFMIWLFPIIINQKERCPL